MNIRSAEARGTFFILASAALWGLFPVLVVKGVESIPPLTFAALSMVVDAVVFALYLIVKRETKQLRQTKAYLPLFWIAVFIIVIPYSLFFLGASYTTGVNATVLLLSEGIFSLIFTHFIGEKTTALKLVGSLAVLIGAFCILFQNDLRPNVGDLLIIASTLTFPLGNFFGKKALRIVSPATILFSRSLIGALFLVAFAVIVDGIGSLDDVIRSHWGFILVNGIVTLGLSKIFWYEGLKRLDISKAIALSMTFPAFGLVYLTAFFGANISGVQWLGIGFMSIGVLLSVMRHSVASSTTKYGSA